MRKNSSENRLRLERRANQCCAELSVVGSPGYPHVPETGPQHMSGNAIDPPQCLLFSLSALLQRSGDWTEWQ